MTFHTDCTRSCTLNHGSSVKRPWHLAHPKDIRQRCFGDFTGSQNAYDSPCTRAASTVFFFIEIDYTKDYCSPSSKPTSLVHAFEYCLSIGEAFYVEAR